MRAYLDTNILVFLFQKNLGEISADTQELIDDCANILMTSTVCVQEFIRLCQIGKVYGEKKRQDNVVEADDILPWIEGMDIKIVPTVERHLATLAGLPLYGDHRDPNDRLIIAQAITDRIPLISSDRKFAKYERYGLELIYNER